MIEFVEESDDDIVLPWCLGADECLEVSDLTMALDRFLHEDSDLDEDATTHECQDAVNLVMDEVPIDCAQPNGDELSARVGFTTSTTDVHRDQSQAEILTSSEGVVARDSSKIRFVLGDRYIAENDFTKDFTDVPLHHLTLPAVSLREDLPIEDIVSMAVYTDGSYEKGKASWAVVIVQQHQDGREVLHGTLQGRVPTGGRYEADYESNNSAEICAIEVALNVVQFSTFPHWQLGSDSEIALKGIFGNQKKGLREAARSRAGVVDSNKNFSSFHVAAHEGHIWNELADSVAKAVIKEKICCSPLGRLSDDIDFLYAVNSGLADCPGYFKGYGMVAGPPPTVYFDSNDLVRPYEKEEPEESKPKEECVLRLASANVLSMGEAETTKEKVCA